MGAIASLHGRVLGVDQETGRLVRAADDLAQGTTGTPNGSTVTVGTSYRGGTPGLLHWSEAGKTSIDSPETAREILTGAVQAVPASGRVWRRACAMRAVRRAASVWTR